MNDASVIIVTYNSSSYIHDCIKSVLSNDPLEIVVVDNDSKDNTVEIIEKSFSGVKVVRIGKNVGYGAGINIGVECSRGEYVIAINPDTVVLNESLGGLLTPIRSDEKTITTPKILLMGGAEINTCGNINHFTGLTFTRGFKQPYSEYAEKEYVSGISGACFAIKKSEFDKIGGFDPDLFLYNEDSEFSWRSLGLNYKILFVPETTILHHYQLNVSPVKLYNLEKNRYIILRKNYGVKEYLITLPSLLLTEILVAGYAIKLGWNGVSYKLKAIKDGCFCKINKLKPNKQNLFRNLKYEIAVEQLTNNLIEKYIKILFIKLYKLNYDILKLYL